ncbi:MAG: alpha-glucosidase, partial [Chloroflexota bacterium]|nr:alpha-glucosidase [Chloroflexota bacterium]
QARSPMPWGGGPNGGFSTARPWLRTAPDAESRNVANQERDPSSVLAAYRKLIWLRRRHPALQLGAYRQLGSGSHDLLAYERSTADETVIVAINFGASPASYRIRTGRQWTVIFDTHERPTGDVSGGDLLTLGPREALILLAG